MALLRLRDSLIDAEWSGHAIDGGGRRLDAIAELEGVRDPVLPVGTADRLAAVQDALGSLIFDQTRLRGIPSTPAS